MHSNRVGICLLALAIVAAPTLSLAAEATGSDRQTVCGAARDQARKEAGKKAQLGDCKCSKSAVDGTMTCSVSAQ